MHCPKCLQTTMGGSRFCRHCGFPLIGHEMEGRTIVEEGEKTILESEGDLSEKTKLIQGGPIVQKPLFFAWLVGLDGPDQGKDYRIIKEKMSIGKAEESDMVIQNDFVSRNHALLTYEKGKFVLNDLGSTNHTFVNEKKISKRILKDDDVIRFGGASYKFKCL